MAPTRRRRKRSGEALTIQNLLTGSSFTEFLSVMVTNFSHFHPVGVVLVAMLGIGVAEHTGFINAAIRSLLNVTPASLLTPMVILVGIVSHSAVDAGDADVEHPVNLVAHHLGGDDRFLGHGSVGGPGRGARGVARAARHAGGAGIGHLGDQTRTRGKWPRANSRLEQYFCSGQHCGTA